MKVKLICQDPLASPRELLLDQFPADLGRGLDVTIRIDDRWLSRRHCRLEVADGAVTIRDLGSRHGTYVNGKRITDCKLLPGDKLCVGLTHFVAEFDPPPTAPELATTLTPVAALA